MKKLRLDISLEETELRPEITSLEQILRFFIVESAEKTEFLQEIDECAAWKEFKYSSHINTALKLYSIVSNDDRFIDFLYKVFKNNWDKKTGNENT